MKDSWTPLWSKIVNSSLWDEPDDVVKVFMTLLACKDEDHVVRMSAYEIGRCARKTEAEALEALKVLSEPDGKRLEPQPFDGRRVQRVEGGWLILNGEKYRQEMAILKRRAQKAAWQRNHRASIKPTPPGTAAERDFVDAHGAGEADELPRIAEKVEKVEKVEGDSGWGT